MGDVISPLATSQMMNLVNLHRIHVYTDLSASKGPFVEDLGLVAVDECQHSFILYTGSSASAVMEGLMARSKAGISQPHESTYPE